MSGLLARKAARAVTERARETGQAPPDWLKTALDFVRDQEKSALGVVLNLSGTILHTGLGRAPLSEAAIEAVTRACRHTALELDLETGSRGDRQTWVRSMLCELTGAEDALVVNNCAAAVVLTLTALTGGGEVVLSRGEMVEIGGAFRMPEIIKLSGARLVEVGCTNKTRIGDYEAALSENTRALLRCHRSNFALIGFQEEASASELAALAHSKGLLFLEDQGNGCLIQTDQSGLKPERTLRQAIEGGADVVMASGDKLLGAAQAGLILGRKDLIATIKKHPLARAFRIDKLSLAALAATLQQYTLDQQSEIPTLWAIRRPQSEIRAQAERLLAQLNYPQLELVGTVTEVGGGSMPGQGLPSIALAINSPQPDQLARNLRLGAPGILGFVSKGRVMLDCRTLPPSEEIAFVARLSAELASWSMNS